MIFHSKRLESLYIKLHKKMFGGWGALQWSFRDSQWGYEFYESTTNLDKKYERVCKLTALVRFGAHNG